jgi:hypothetical protein
VSAPTAVDAGALLHGLARPRTVAAPRRSPEDSGGYSGPERRSTQQFARLAREHDQLCIEACDPWEIAAGLEAAGVDDRRARAEFAVASVFDLAVELFGSVPRRPPVEPRPRDPWHRPLRHFVLRGVVNALPAVAYLAGLNVLGPRAALVPLLVPAVLAAGAAQVLSVLDHLLLGRGERAAARRLVLLVLTAAVIASGAWVGASPLVGVDRDVAFTGAAQLVYVLTATALLVAGRDGMLLLLLLPVVGLGAALLLAHGRLAATLHEWIMPSAGVTLAAAVLFAVLSHRGGGRGRGGKDILELLSPGEVGLALECGGYGLAASLLVAFPLLDALAGRPAPQLLPVAMAPFLVTSGLAERLVHRLRGTALVALHASTMTSVFAQEARAGLRRGVFVQGSAAFLTAVAALWGAVLFAPAWVDTRLALLAAACAVLSVVLVLTALMVSLGQQREAGLALGVAAVWDAALRPLLAPLPLPLLEVAHVLVAVAALLGALLVVGRRYESPSAHR